MSRFRTSFLIWLLGLSTLWFAGGNPAFAQQTPPDETEAEQEKTPPTPWPPKDAARHEIMRKEVSENHGLVLYTPKNWKLDGTPNKSRLAEFTIPAEPQALTLRVFSFENDLGGGGVPGNIQRWTDQFSNLREKKILTGTTRKQELQNGLYVLVDLKGTYKKAGAEPIANARMLAAIVGIRWMEQQTVDGKTESVPKSAAYFLEMVGPEAAVSANEKHFRHAFGAVDQENELKDNEDLKKEADAN